MGTLVKYTEGNDTVTLAANHATTTVYAYGGDDTVTSYNQAGMTGDFFDLGDGIDTLIFPNTSFGDVYFKNWSMSGSAINVNSPKIQNGYVSDSWMSVERVQFADKKMAVDFYALQPGDTYATLTGHAAEAVKMLGVTFGAASVHNPLYVGIILGALDDGWTYGAAVEAVIRAAGGTTNEKVVDLLWTNLTGSHPTTEQAKWLVDGLNNHSFTVAELGVTAADLAQNANNIDLVGLAKTGIEFI